MTESVATPRSNPIAPAVADVDPRRWIVLSVVLIGGFMAILDASIMNVAVPSIRDDLHATFGDIELVVAAYTLVYAMLLITGGRLGDLYGRKTLFLAGAVVFTIASALCGLATSPLMLIASRALQGIGGAMMFPQILALIQLSFREPERTRALAWFGCVISAGAIVGQIVGGLIISANIGGLSWRPTFLVNIPIGAAVLIIGAIMLKQDERACRGEPRLRGRGTCQRLAVAVVCATHRREGCWVAALGARIANRMCAGFRRIRLLGARSCSQRRHSAARCSVVSPAGICGWAGYYARVFPPGWTRILADSSRAHVHPVSGWLLRDVAAVTEICAVVWSAHAERRICACSIRLRGGCGDTRRSRGERYVVATCASRVADWYRPGPRRDTAGGGLS